MKLFRDRTPSDGGWLAEEIAPVEVSADENTWLGAELARRDAETASALMVGIEQRAALARQTDRGRHDSWLASEIARRDGETAVALQSALDERLARIDRIVGA